MVKNVLKDNALVLNEEISWFVKVLDTRLKLYFGHDCDYKDVYFIEPPHYNGIDSLFADFVKHYTLTFEERVILILSLIPHIKPQLLDVFLTNNSATGQSYIEFGGIKANNGGFLPTAETAIFILSGENLEQRFSAARIFEGDHFFSKHNIISIESVNPSEPFLNGLIKVSREFIDFFTTGQVRKPNFGIDFPAKLIETSMGIDDLVLENYTIEQIMEIKTWIEYKDVLMNDWELGKKLKPGYRSLFYGPPGTGKTFTASLLGKMTGKDVYRIDLSTVVSKYIGETEKNLEKVFKQAEFKNWILFFDEADALFGKRTNVSDAHDKFANQEVSYLLQRLEEYDGVVILASNFKSNIDDAFTRRFQSIIHFPMPKQEERLRLWKNAFSSKCEIEKSADLTDISSRFELSGGSIMNVVRYCSLMAVKRNTNLILHNDIIEGIRKELQKEGKTL